MADRDDAALDALLARASKLWTSDDPRRIRRGLGLLRQAMRQASKETLSVVLMQIALASDRLGEVEEAAAFLQRAADFDEETGELSDVWFRYPVYIALRRLEKRYPLALRLLKAGSPDTWEFFDLREHFAMLAVPGIIAWERGRLAEGARLAAEALEWTEDDEEPDLDWGDALVPRLKEIVADPGTRAALKATPDPGHLRGRVPRTVEAREERRLLVQLAELDIRVRRASHLSFYPRKRLAIGMPLVLRTLLSLPVDRCWRLKEALNDVLRDDDFAATVPDGGDRLIELFERTPLSDFKRQLAPTLTRCWLQPRHVPRLLEVMKDARHGPARCDFAELAAKHAPREDVVAVLRRMLEQALRDPASTEPGELLQALAKVGTAEDASLALKFSAWDHGGDPTMPDTWTRKAARDAAKALKRGRR